MNYSQGDLMLSRTSPARNAGTAQNAPVCDYFRVPRSGDAGPVDIGACEYSLAKYNAVSVAWAAYE